MWEQLEAICSELRAAGEKEMAWRLAIQISWCEAERKLPGLSAEEIAGAVLGLESLKEAAALGLPSDVLGFL
jgi:hypothetical protein